MSSMGLTQRLAVERSLQRHWLIRLFLQLWDTGIKIGALLNISVFVFLGNMYSVCILFSIPLD
jgi:hypothetical protein